MHYHEEQTKLASLIEAAIGSIFSFCITFLLSLYVYPYGFMKQLGLSIIFLMISIICRYIVRRSAEWWYNQRALHD